MPISLRVSITFPDLSCKRSLYTLALIIRKNVRNASTVHGTLVVLLIASLLLTLGPGRLYAQSVTQAPYITTVAGTGLTTHNGDNIRAANANLYFPRDLVFDRGGNLYIVEYLNHRIRRVDTNGIITTVAGNGTAGYSGDGGPATSAQLNRPTGIALDSAGNIFITDDYNFCVRKVNIATGVITTVAGTGTLGDGADGGLASATPLGYVGGLTFDTNGNLYIADMGYNRIRKVDPDTQKITTVAGNGGTGGYNGDNIPATSAQLNDPASVAVDANGNLYIAEYWNHRIRKVTNGIITTIAGNGTAGYSGDGSLAVNAQLNNPAGVTLDSAGNVYIADEQNYRIRKLNVATGLITTVVGSGTQCSNSTAGTAPCGDGGTATTATLYGADRLAIDSKGDFYIADEADNRVRKVVNGPVPFLNVAVGSSNSQLVRLSFNTDLTIASWGVTLPDYTPTLHGTCGPDITAGTICEWAVQFSPVRPGTRWGSFVVTDGSGNKYSFGLEGTGVAPAVAFTPAMITSAAGNGTMAFSGDGGPASGAGVYNPVAVAVNSRGDLYIAENGDNDYRVRKVDAFTGIINTVAGSGPSTFPGPVKDGGLAIESTLYYPHGMAVDSAGNLYIADVDNMRVRKVDANGIISTFAGAATGCAGGIDPWGDGCPAYSVILYNPISVAAGEGGTLYIVDYASSRILKVDALGILTTVAGSVPLGPGNGPDGVLATNSSLNYPRDIALDSAGNLYIADTLNYRVRKVDANGIISTVAGNGTKGNAPDGSIAMGSPIGAPFAVAVDPAGNLYIADMDNLLIRKVDRNGIMTRVAGGGTGCAQQTDPVGDGCPATDAQFSAYGQQGLAVDSLGNLYIVDGSNNRVRKVSFSAPPSLTFPDTPVGSTSQPIDVAIENVGNNALNISQITTLGYFNVLGQDTSCSLNGQSLSPSVSCILGIQFQPLSATLTSGAVTLTDNALNATPSTSQSITAIGAGTCSGGQTINFVAPSTQTYGASPLILNATSSSGLPISYVVTGPATQVGNTLTITGTGTITVQAIQNGNSYCSPATPVTVSFNVNPARLTIIADNKTMGVGSRVPTLTATYIGFVNGETTADLNNSPILQTVATSSSPAGDYSITISQGSLSSPNYTFDLVPGTLTVNPSALNFFNNFFVTGDYAVGSISLQSGPGAITMPGSIPTGAQFVGAFLYWQTWESSASAPASQIQFRGYTVLTGQQLGSDLPYTYNSTPGVLRTYRANVLPYLPAGDTGLSNAVVNVNMPTGWAGSYRQAIGASLVVVYRVLSNQRDIDSGKYLFPLKAVILYDGSWAPPTSGGDMYQSISGFYESSGPISVTAIFNSAGTWQQQQPGNPSVIGDHVATDVPAVSAAGAVILSTPVNADTDGLLTAWKNQGFYTDALNGSRIDLPGATVGKEDLYIQIDYMCSVVKTDGTCDTQTGHSHLPTLDALQRVANAFEFQGINVHFDVGNNYQDQPHIVPSSFAKGGNVIAEQACTEAAGANPPQCVVPNEAGMVGWKMGLGLIKMGPRDSDACAHGGSCEPRFQHGRKDSYHYVLFGHSVAVPAWSFTNQQLQSVAVSQNTVTITTTAPHGIDPSASPRITIAEAISQPYLNGIYVPTKIDDFTFAIQTTNVFGPINNTTDPGLSIYSGKTSSASGFSDVGGADSIITLGNWKYCLDGTRHITTNCAPNAAQDDSLRVNVQAGSLMHELGHSLALTHGGAYYDLPNSYVANFETNCKSNYLSVMNYLFQIDLLGPNHDAVDYSSQVLGFITENAAGNGSSWGASPIYAMTSWYSPVPLPEQSPTFVHCDGSPNPANTGMYRMDGPASLLNWTAGQDINFNGQLDTSMRGYNDWENRNLRQIGATGSHFVSGGVLLPNGGGVLLSNGGGILLPNGGGVLRADGGVILVNGGGVLLPNGGGLLLPNGGGVLLPSGGVVLPNGGGVLLANGGGVQLPNGTIWNQTGVPMLNGGGVLLANGGGVLLPNGGGVVLPNGGGVLLANGGGVVLANGGGVLLPNGGGILLANGGGVLLPNGGGVVLANGGGVQLPNGGGVLLANGGGVQLPGGGVLLANGGGVVLPNGGGVLLANGGGVVLANGGGVTLPNGGGVTLPNGGGVLLPNGGGVLLPNGGGVEMTYEAANSFVRAPLAPTKTQIQGAIKIEWTAPTFGVISQYTVFRGDGSFACSSNGNPPPTTCSVPDAQPAPTYFVVATVPDISGPPRNSEPAFVKFAQTATITGVPSTAVFGDGPFTIVATATSGLPVSLVAGPNCLLSGTKLSLTGAGTCTVTASQAGNSDYNPAPSITQTFTIAKANAVIKVTPYNVAYDGAAHTAAGSALGAGGADVSARLKLSATTHTAVGDYPLDLWTFSGAPDYNDANGIVHDVIGAWTLKGFYAPVSMSNNTQVVWNTVKGGSTVPLRFNVFAGSVEQTSIAAVKGGSASIYSIKCTTGLQDPIDESELAQFSNTGNTSLRYDTTAGRFIQNWQTPKNPGSCYGVRLTTQDGSMLTAYFQLVSK